MLVTAICTRAVFVGPDVAPAGEDAAGIEPGVHAVSVEFDLVQPIGAVRCLLDENGELRLCSGG